MAPSNEKNNEIGNPSSWLMPPAFSNPMMTMLADMNGTLLEGFATAQKDWMEFAQRRIREDVEITRRLLHSQSLADKHEIYSRYLQTAFQHYREQSEKVAQRGERFAQQFAQTTAANAKEVARARH